MTQANDLGIQPAQPPVEGRTLEVRDLTVEYGTGRHAVRAVEGLSFRLGPGERLGIVGESGSGKTTLGLAIAALLPRSAAITRGSIRYGGRELVGASPKELRSLRGRRIAVVFQDAKTALDPVRTIGSQIAESVMASRRASRAEALGVAMSLLKEVEIPDPQHRLRQYPHELSGGMRQRAMIAMALAGEPELLIADEPTSALDVTTQANVVSLLKRLGEERAMSTILITHDLGVVAGFADSIAVLYAGAAMEVGSVETVFTDAAHPYSRALIRSVPSLTGARRRRLDFIAGSLPTAHHSSQGCRFRPRCDVGADRPECAATEPTLAPNALGTLAACLFPGERAAAQPDVVGATSGPDERDDDEAASTLDAIDATPPDPMSGGTATTEGLGTPLLSLREIRKSFEIRRRENGERLRLRAVDGVSFDVARGESFGIVGESGSGKTTLARILVGLLRADSGTIDLVSSSGDDDAGAGGARWRRGDVQMIFQDPGDSLDPQLDVAHLVAEPLEITIGGRARRHRAAVVEALTAVGLSPIMLSRRASELSGGQRQRVAIARALTTDPILLVADEAVASLDMSARGQVLNLLADIQERSGLTCLHISHDLSMVRHVCQRVAVMHAGRVVELATTEQLFSNPKHPYTAGLISAVPTPDPDYERRRKRVPVVGEPPDLTRAVVGCAYRSRCPRAADRCADEEPLLTEGESGHLYACHFPEPRNVVDVAESRSPSPTPRHREQALLSCAGHATSSLDEAALSDSADR
jgi:peptide/nickel transport system ATP-binding protein